MTTSFQTNPQELEFIAQCHWQIESEFNLRTREVIIDMRKLVMGSAENKLFIAVHRNNQKQEDAILEQCSEIA